MPDRPIVAEDAILESRRQAYLAEGIQSMLAVPLKTHGVVTGTIVFYYRTRRFDDVTVRVASALADLSGSALGLAELYELEARSRRRAEEADRRKSEFIAMLAHELRNPLTPIRNSLQLLQLRADNNTVIERVREMMERQVVHLARLIDDLLDVSRITLGKVQLRREPLDLAGLVRELISDHRPAFEDKRVRLTAAINASSPVWIDGDATRLAQVLDNLLGNALKFTPAGGAVDVSLDLADQAVLTVRDTGAGIDPDMLLRLFEPLSQADRTLDRSAGGLGLGLAIVKGLVELHGGSVRAESAGLGCGSSFVLELPPAAGPAGATRRTEPLPAPGRGLRVLIVEDNRDAAESLRMLLEAYEYQVEVAYTGPDGVHVAREVKPGVVICDLGLPGLDGFGVAKELRADPRTADARLIALTGYGQADDRDRARDAGFDDHLIKPADPDAIRKILVAC
jgi:signal transduction histidine kinase/CheY-like chemotaxis protein